MDLNNFNKVLKFKKKLKNIHILRELETNTILFDAFRDKIERRDPIKNILDLKLLRWGEDSHLWDKSVDVIIPNRDYIFSTDNQIIFRKYKKKIRNNSISENKDLVSIKKLDYINSDRLRILDYYIVNVSSREMENVLFRAKMWKRKLKNYDQINYTKKEATFGLNIIDSWEMHKQKKKHLKLLFKIIEFWKFIQIQ